ncbi:hypothetical protein BDZ89DRAFT_249425 [Hymenopellis radicata]|nr:hypothetical protein BDZ89DRAFT_249425 [Hymenopellis radicata]
MASNTEVHSSGKSTCPFHRGSPRILVRMSSFGVADITLARSSLFMPPPTLDVAILPNLCTLTLHDGPYHPSTPVLCMTSFLKAVHLPNLTSLTLDVGLLSPLNALRGGSCPSILNLSLSVPRFGPHGDSQALGTFLVYASSVRYFALHVQADVDLELVFSRAKDAFMELPIHSLTFTGGGSVTMSHTDGVSLAGNTFSALWRKGVFKTLSIHPASFVGNQAMTTLRGLVEKGLVLDIRDANASSWRLDCGEVDC